MHKITYYRAPYLITTLYNELNPNRDSLMWGFYDGVPLKNKDDIISDDSRLVERSIRRWGTWNFCFILSRSEEKRDVECCLMINIYTGRAKELLAQKIQIKIFSNSNAAHTLYKEITSTNRKLVLTFQSHKM